jgi:hypothetical protein
MTEGPGAPATGQERKVAGLRTLGVACAGWTAIPLRHTGLADVALAVRSVVVNAAH